MSQNQTGISIRFSNHFFLLIRLPHVAGQGEAEAGPDGRTVDGRDDGDLEVADVEEPLVELPHELRVPGRSVAVPLLQKLERERGCFMRHKHLLWIEEKPYTQSDL